MADCWHQVGFLQQATAVPACTGYIGVPSSRGALALYKMGSFWFRLLPRTVYLSRQSTVSQTSNNPCHGCCGSPVPLLLHSPHGEHAQFLSHSHSLFIQYHLGAAPTPFRPHPQALLLPCRTPYCTCTPAGSADHSVRFWSVSTTPTQQSYAGMHRCHPVSAFKYSKGVSNPHYMTGCSQQPGPLNARQTARYLHCT
jgi:hypothetical protein